MAEAEQELDCIPVDARPTGAKLEIPEIGVSITADSREMVVTQEFPSNDGEGFLKIVEALVSLAEKHFRPASVQSNGFALESFLPMTSVSAGLKETLSFGGDFHVHLSRIVGMPPVFKALDYTFTSGKSELHVTATPATFEKRTVTKYTAPMHATALQRKQVERRNAKNGRSDLQTEHAVLLSADLIEFDPPLKGINEHFLKLLAIVEALKKSNLKLPPSK